jgi:hypothetical protein
MLQNPRRDHFILCVMRWTVALLLALACLAPVQAQERPWRGPQGQKEGFAPRERVEREQMRRERSERSELRREQRFTPAEREKLRQDLIDANRDMRQRRR